MRQAEPSRAFLPTHAPHLQPSHTQPAPRAQVPFTLTCGTPGRLRWVTTNIARFDPSVDWPTDLACEFKWNQGLKSFDGGRRRRRRRLQPSPPPLLPL